WPTRPIAQARRRLANARARRRRRGAPNPTAAPAIPRAIPAPPADTRTTEAPAAPPPRGARRAARRRNHGRPHRRRPRPPSWWCQGRCRLALPFPYVVFELPAAAVFGHAPQLERAALGHFGFDRHRHRLTRRTIQRRRNRRDFFHVGADFFDH